MIERHFHTADFHATGLRCQWALSLALMLAATVGCNDSRPERVPVSGRVVIDGEPLTRGSIKFVPQQGRPSSGEIGEDGHFTLSCYDGADGALVARHRVQINANRPISERKVEIFTPKKYADFRTSEIEVDVQQPTDDLVIELTWGDRKGPYVESL